METLTHEEVQNILDTTFGGLKFRDMTAITFKQYILKKIDGRKTYDPKIMELSAFCNSMTFSTSMPEDQKLSLLMKIKEMGITIP
jgi:hypothetical protein